MARAALFFSAALMRLRSRRRFRSLAMATTPVFLVPFRTAVELPGSLFAESGVVRRVWRMGDADEDGASEGLNRRDRRFPPGLVYVCFWTLKPPRARFGDSDDGVISDWAALTGDERDGV